MSKYTSTRSGWNPDSPATRRGSADRVWRILALHAKGMTPREIAQETGEHTWFVNRSISRVENALMGGTGVGRAV